MGQVNRLTNLTTGGPVLVDVRDDKIVRIIPLQLESGDGPPGSITARGRDFTPPLKNTLSNLDRGAQVHHLLAPAHPYAARKSGLQP
jgi:hypothetical protein